MNNQGIIQSREQEDEQVIWMMPYDNDWEPWENTYLSNKNEDIQFDNLTRIFSRIKRQPGTTGGDDHIS